MTNNSKRTIEDDEIDLGKLFFRFFFLIRRKFKVLLLFSLLGLGLGLAYYVVTPKVYYSSMTISTGMLTTFNSKSLFNTLESLIREKNYPLLSKKLNLNIDEVIDISSITVVPLAKDEEESDRANLFQIEVNVRDRNVLNNLQNGIIYYLEENPYVKKRIDIKKKNLDALLKKINEEMVGLDTLKENLGASINLSRDNNVVILDPVNAYKETVNLFQRKLELQAELELIDNIQVIEDFTYFERTVSPRFRGILFGFFGGFLFGVLFILVIEFIKYTKSIEASEYA